MSCVDIVRNRQWSSVLSMKSLRHRPTPYLATIVLLSTSALHDVGSRNRIRPHSAVVAPTSSIWRASLSVCGLSDDVLTLSRWTLTTRNMSFSRSLRVLNKVIISVIHYSVWDSYMNVALLLYLRLALPQKGSLVKILMTRLAIPHKGSVIKFSIYYILYSEFVRFYKHIYKH